MREQSAEMHQGAHVTVSMDGVWESWILGIVAGTSA